jgi:CBS domain-containing protein
MAAAAGTREGPAKAFLEPFGPPCRSRLELLRPMRVAHESTTERERETTMQVQEIMTRDVDIIDPSMKICDAACRMRDEDVGALPVGENDRLIGMVTDRDIVIRAVAEDRAPKDADVREVMSERIFYCFEDDAVEQASKTMAEHQVRRLPVLNRDKRLTGIVALADIAMKAPQASEMALEGVSERTGQARR